MKINVNMSSYPVAANVSDDVLTLTHNDGTEKDVGRLSGYSDSELIDPIIKDDGYFNWYSPARELLGNVFIRPSISTIDTISTVQGIGLFEGSFKTDSLTELYLTPGMAIFLDKLLIPVTATKKLQNNDETVFLNEVRATVEAASGYAYSAVTENTGLITLSEDEHYLEYEFPLLTTIDSFMVLEYTTRYGATKCFIEYSDDRKNWKSTEQFSMGYQNRQYRFTSLTTVVDENATTEETLEELGIVSFDEPISAKYIRLKKAPEERSIAISVFYPLINVEERKLVRLHKYEDLNVDPDSFTIIETENSVSLLPLAGTDTTYDLSNSKSLERRLSLKDDTEYGDAIFPYIPFREKNEFVPGVSSTLEYTYFNGGITLNAGSYLIDLEIETYSFSFFSKSPTPESVTNTQGVRQGRINLTDVVRNTALTEGYFYYNRALVPTFDWIETITSNTVLNATRLKDILLSLNASPSGSSELIATTMEPLIIIYNLKEVTSLSGFYLHSAYSYTSGNNITVEGTNDLESDVWEMVYEKTDLKRTRNTLSQVWFDTPGNYKHYKVTFPRTTGIGGYDGYCRVVPIKNVSGDYKKTMRINWELVLSGKTTIGVEITKDSSGAKVRHRQLDIYKVSGKSLSELYRIDSFDKPVSTYKMISQTSSVPNINLSKEEGDELSTQTGFFSFSDTSEMTIYFPGPVRLWRQGSERYVDNVYALDMFTVSDKIEDVSHLQHMPGFPTIDGLVIHDGTGPYSDREYPNYSSVISAAAPNPYLLGRLEIDTTWATYDDEGNDIEVTLLFNEEKQINGMYETLVTEFPLSRALPTGSPKNVTAYYQDLETDEWIHIGGIDEQYKVSLDGTARSGAADYESSYRVVSDGKRRYYALDETVTAKKFKFVLQNGISGRALAMKELGLCLIPEGMDSSLFPDNSQLAAQVNDILPFTDVIPGGTYTIKNRIPYLSRVDRQWFIEAITEGE